MSGRNLRSFSFLILPFLLVSSFIGCGDQGSSTSGTPAPAGVLEGDSTIRNNRATTSGSGIALDSSANIYITGSTDGNLDGNISSGILDIFLTKFDSTGNKLFTRQFGTTGRGYWLWDRPWTAAEMFMSPARPEGLWELALSAYPTSSWPSLTLPEIIFLSSSSGQPFNDIGYGVAVDSSGNVYITGSTEGSLGSISASGYPTFSWQV